MAKKILALVLTACVLGVMVGCSKSADDAGTTGTTGTTTATTGTTTGK